MKKSTASKSENFSNSRFFPCISLLFIPICLLSTKLWAQAPPDIDGSPAEWPGVLAQPGVNGLYIEDHVNSSFDNIWTQGSSDVNLISSWTVATGEPNDKNDLRNTAAVTINNIIYFAADRHSNTGDAELGYWLLQDPVTRTGTGFSGAHRDGDVLIRTHFVNGGETTDRGIFVWINGSLMEVELDPGALNFATNATTVSVPAPWNYSPKSGTSGNYPPNSFVEGFLDLNMLKSALDAMNLGLDPDPCFSYFLISTGNSQSENSSLEDLVHGRYGNKPLPQDLTGSATCANGSASGTVSLASSEMNIIYQLQQYDDISTNFNNVGDPMVGDGSELNFENLSAGSYYMKANISGSDCFTRFGPVDVLINSVEPGQIGPDMTICVNDDPAAFRSVEATGDGRISYQWFVSADGSNWREFPDAIGEIFDPEPLAEERWFKRVAYSTLGELICSAETEVVKITVNKVNSGTIGGDQTICAGEVPDPILARPDEASGTLSYQWYASTDNEVWRSIPGEGAQQASFEPGQLTEDRWFKREVTSLLDGVECSDESNVVKVTVINFEPGEIGTNHVICEGDDPEAFSSVAASGDGRISYQWQESSNAEDWNDIPDATGEIYDPGQLAEDHYFRRKATASLNGIECSAESNEVHIYVNNLEAGTIAEDQTLCTGEDPEIILGRPAPGDGEISYQWEVSVDGTNFREIEEAKGKDFDPAPFSEDVRWYRRITTSTVRDTQCSEGSNVVQITINKVASGAIGADQTICAGDDPDPILARADEASGDISYQWFVSADNQEWRSLGEEAQEATYDPGVLTEDRWFKREISSTLNGVTCKEESNVIKITVINFEPGEIGPDMVICEGEDPTAFRSVAASGDGRISYQWQESSNAKDWSAIPDATNETYDPGTLEEDRYFRRMATAWLNGTACSMESNVILIFVNNLEAGTIEEDRIICEGEDPEVILGRPAPGDGEITYQWEVSTDGVTFRILEEAVGKDYDPGTFSEDARWYKRIATSTVRGVECSRESDITRIMLNQVTPGSIGPDQTICEGDDPGEISSRSAEADGTVTYYWLRSTDGESYEIIDDAVSATYDPGTLYADHWYRRGAVSTIGDNACRKLTDPVKITVNNLASGNIGSHQTICRGDSPARLDTTSEADGDADMIYQWQVSTDGVVFEDVPAGGNDAHYKPGILVTDHWYKRQVTSILNGIECTVESNIVKITVEDCIVCETAFAKAATMETAHCFIDDDPSNDFEENPNSERWGWTNEFFAGSEAFTATMDLYAGAGQCDTGSAKVVGNVTLEYDPSAGSVVVDYEITAEGHAMNSAHLYVGCEPYPMQKKGRTYVPTVSPGKYPFNRSSEDYFYRYETGPIEVGEGVFYVIAHANVCTSENWEYYPFLVNNENVEYFTAKGNKALEFVCGTAKGGSKKSGSKAVSAETFKTGAESDVSLYPLPFDEQINLQYQIDYTTDVTIEVFNMRGNHLRTYTDRNVTKGSVTRLQVDFEMKANQIYILKVKTDRETFVEQIVSSKK